MSDKPDGRDAMPYESLTPDEQQRIYDTAAMDYVHERSVNG